jgi:sugar phosphate isomerase/epimerase
MYLTGFADEAARDIDGQIRATQRLGWRFIEARGVGGRNLHDIEEREFDAVCEKLGQAGISVNCFGSAIANWGKRIDQPFDSSLAETKRAVVRMQRLNTKLVRIMSFAVLPDREPRDQMREERFSRLRTLVSLFRDAGLVPVHENCMNYGGMAYPFTLELLENVPGLKLVFDTGNPVTSEDFAKSKPYPRQSSWEFYRNVKEHVEYVHIKDAVHDSETGEHRYTWPGEGQGDVRRIVKDLLDSGYQGGFSMEPHLKVVFHQHDPGGEEQARLETYLEYGRRFTKLLEEIGYAV